MRTNVWNRIAMWTALCGLTACTANDPATFEWKDVAVVRNEANCEIEMNFPQATNGNVAADSVNARITRMLTCGFYEPGNEMAGYSVERAVDSLIAQKSRSEIIAHIPYQLMSSWSVFQRGSFTSLFLENYAYVGGAHGMTVGSFLNFDGLNSEPLSIDQLFTDTVKLAELNRAAFAKFIEQRGGEQVTNYLFVQPDALPLPMNIGFDSTGVVMLYNQYEIAAYAFGQSRYVLPWEEVEPILAKPLADK